MLDCHDLTPLGLFREQLLDDDDYSVGQALAHAALALNVEGLLVPSATLLGDNLIIFPDRLRQGSVIVEMGFVDPALEKRPMRSDM